jgi:hypothetical protein
MNELIQQLAVKAKLMAEEDINRQISYNTELKAFAEKFAELIVRECLQQCERIRDDAYTQKKSEYLTESGRLIYEGVFGGATNCGFAIQQHFGVEE